AMFFTAHPPSACCSLSLHDALPIFMRLVGNYCRDTPGICRATPVHALPRLRESWERALGDEMALSSWRSPQIVILESHQDDWPRSEERRVGKEWRSGGAGAD